MSCLADWRDEHAVGAVAGGAVEPGGGEELKVYLAWRRTGVTTEFESKVLSNLTNHHQPSNNRIEQSPPAAVFQPLGNENLLLAVQMEILGILALRKDLPVVLAMSM